MGSVAARSGPALALVAALSAAACVAAEEPDSGPAVTIGALLPFTGDLAASGNNIEHALLLGAEMINASGGVCGLPVRIESRDTQSDATRGIIAVNELVKSTGTRIILGPEEEEVASLVVPTIERLDVVLISGGLTSPLITSLNPRDLWFRISPSPNVLGEALAERMRRDGRRSASVIFVADEYGSGLANIIATALRSYRIDVAASVGFAPLAPSFHNLIGEALEPSPEAVVLIAYPSSGAKLVQEIAISGNELPLYLSPTLRSEQFARNVPPRTLDRAIGVALDVLPGGDAFVDRYAERWDGDLPLTSSFYYFDALMVAALAIEHACQREGSPATVEAIRDSIRRVSDAPGADVTWNELDAALAQLRSGEDVNYEGVSSAVEFDQDGAVIGGFHRFWRFVGGAIQDE